MPTPRRHRFEFWLQILGLVILTPTWAAECFLLFTQGHATGRHAESLPLVPAIILVGLLTVLLVTLAWSVASSLRRR